MAFKSPLTREQYDTLKRDQKKLQEISEAIQRAESCDIDCSGQKGALQQLTEMLNKYEKNFFEQVPK